MKEINICLVDDHHLFREGLVFLLEQLDYVQEIKEADSGAKCLSILNGWNADIVLMDIEMPDLNGIETTKEIKKRFANTNIIALSMYGDEVYYRAMIDAGASGFLLKNSHFNEVKKAITEVANGHHYFSPEILDSFVHAYVRKDKAHDKTNEKLSQRELEILYHICKGLSNHEIGESLSISKRTVDKHRENIMAKTGSGNTAGLVIYAIKEGIFKISGK